MKNKKAADVAEIKRLARRIKQPFYVTVGVLSMIQMLCETNAPDGDLSGFDMDDIADWLEWDGDIRELIDHLVEFKWLDRSEPGRLSATHWKGWF